MSKGWRIAVYDTPTGVSSAISDALRKAGHTVLFEGPLNKETARTDADIWLTKWSFNLKNPFILKEKRPKVGLLSMSVGIDHIDVEAVEKLGLHFERCPTYCSITAAEHAMALSLRGLYRKSILPPLSDGQVIFNNFHDGYAEAAVAQMLFRVRQFDKSIARAKNFDYQRGDEPWETNEELAASKIGIVGRETNAFGLARMLKLGFNCELFGYDTPETLEAFGVQPLMLPEFEECDYVFLCTTTHVEMDERKTIDSYSLEDPDFCISDSKVAVIGPGNIGSIIARMAKIGFNCDVTAFTDEERKPLSNFGISYAPTVTAAIRGAHFIFITVNLTDETRLMVSREVLQHLDTSMRHVLINVARPDICDCKSLLEFISTGAITLFATDVLPEEYPLINGGGDPPELLQKYIVHESVITTPHEAECSKHSRKRLADEVLQQLEKFKG